MPIDPKARQWVIIFLVVMFGLGLLLHLGINAYFENLQDLAAESPASAIQKVMFVLSGVLVAWLLGALAISIYLHRFARRVFSSQQFPPPGTRVIKETPIIRGQAALRRAKIIQMVAFIFALFAAVFPVIIYLMVKSLFGSLTSPI